MFFLNILFLFLYTLVCFELHQITKINKYNWIDIDLNTVVALENFILKITTIEFEQTFDIFYLL